MKTLPPHTLASCALRNYDSSRIVHSPLLGGRPGVYSRGVYQWIVDATLAPYGLLHDESTIYEIESCLDTLNNGGRILLPVHEARLPTLQTSLYDFGFDYKLNETYDATEDQAGICVFRNNANNGSDDCVIGIGTKLYVHSTAYSSPLVNRRFSAIATNAYLEATVPQVANASREILGIGEMVPGLAQNIYISTQSTPPVDNTSTYIYTLTIPAPGNPQTPIAWGNPLAFPVAPPSTVSFDNILRQGATGQFVRAFRIDSLAYLEWGLPALNAEINNVGSYRVAFPAQVEKVVGFELLNHRGTEFLIVLKYHGQPARTISHLTLTTGNQAVIRDLHHLPPSIPSTSSIVGIAHSSPKGQAYCLLDTPGNAHIYQFTLCYEAFDFVPSRDLLQAALGYTMDLNNRWPAYQAVRIPRTGLLNLNGTLYRTTEPLTQNLSITSGTKQIEAGRTVWQGATITVTPPITSLTHAWVLPVSYLPVYVTEEIPNLIRYRHGTQGLSLVNLIVDTHPQSYAGVAQ